jgi:hypothetical protein
VERDNKDVALWKKLRKVESCFTSNSFYRGLRMFRNTFSHPEIWRMPNLSNSDCGIDDDNDDQPGSTEDLYSYVDQFKNLETLDVYGDNIIKHIFDWEQLLSRCGSALEELKLFLVTTPRDINQWAFLSPT